MAAANQGDLERLRGLLSAGVDVHARAPEDAPILAWHSPFVGFSALGFALAAGRLACVRALVAAGAQLDPDDASDRLALQYVSADVTGETREALGLRKSQLPKPDDAIRVEVSTRNLFRAVRARDFALLRAVARQRPLMNSSIKGEPLNPMELVAREGDVEMARALLDAGADADLGIEHSPLGTAARHGHGEMVRLLIDAGADLNAMSGNPMTDRKRTALVEAADAGHVEIVRALLSAARTRNVKLIRKGDAAGHAAARGHAEIVELLDTTGQAKSRGTKVIATERANMLLHLLQGNDITGAHALIAEITEPEVASEALGMATLCRGYDCVPLLLRKGADPNWRKRPSESSPLRDVVGARTVTDDVVAAVRALVAAGAELDEVSSSGEPCCARSSARVVNIWLAMGSLR